MLPLRHAGLWRVLSVLLLLAVLVAAVSPVFWFDSRIKALAWIDNLDKWVHALTFAVLSIWFAGLIAKNRYWRILVGLLAFGLVIEGCQLMVTYRSADWTDMGANALGIIIGLTVAMAGLGGWCPRIEDWYSRRTEP